LVPECKQRIEWGILRTPNTPGVNGVFSSANETFRDEAKKKNGEKAHMASSIEAVRLPPSTLSLNSRNTHFCTCRLWNYAFERCGCPGGEIIPPHHATLAF
jgi:hypothetical protein